MHSSSNKAIIIGAGVAGLAGAIRLAVQGMQVTVYEKNTYPGGKLGHFEMKGYRFDAGPSLFTQPQNIEELFALAGENIEMFFKYNKLPVSCHYFYEDGSFVRAYADRNLFSEELVRKLGEKKNSLHTYLDRSEKAYKHIGTVFLNHSLHKKATLWKAGIFRAIKSTRWSYLFRSLHQLNAAHFSNPKTVQLFNRYATYNGSSPYKAPGMLSLIPHLEHNEGSFYPLGGMVSIANALYRLALKKGVRFYFNTPVQRIIHNETVITGVVVNEENIDADVVVSNLDVYFTYKQLLGDEHKARKIEKQERSSSALIFYWGVKKEFPSLDLHNIFFAKDYEAEFDHLFRLKKMYNDPTVYINITAKCEPGIQAPKESENWFVMVNVPANIGQDWNVYKEKYRAAIIAKLNRLLQTDIEPLIEVEEILDPVLIEERTSSYRGSLYGTSSNSRMAAFLRHPNFSKAYQGLYFVGGSVHPGGGIPLCLQSARIMSDIVSVDRKKQHS
ncbi:MAG: 1-hydroxycarotenoid 3,4-desaturase CrtD [Bacteroidota bacterium]